MATWPRIVASEPFSTAWEVGQPGEWLHKIAAKSSLLEKVTVQAACCNKNVACILPQLNKHIICILPDGEKKLPKNVVSCSFFFTFVSQGPPMLWKPNSCAPPKSPNFWADIKCT